MIYTYYNSPVGKLLLGGDGDAISLISFPRGSRARQPMDDWVKQKNGFPAVTRQLDEYFCGQRLSFDLQLAPVGTPFQQLVWGALLAIPYAGISYYGELARQIHRPNASRAVGAANGANPIPIIIPCHRVIGKNGKLTGFGGGLEIKQWLLEHERRHCPAELLKTHQTEIAF